MAKFIIRVYVSNLTPFNMTKVDAWVFDGYGDWSSALVAPDIIPAGTTGIWQSENSALNWGTSGFAKYQVMDDDADTLTTRGRNIIHFAWDSSLGKPGCFVSIEPPATLGASGALPSGSFVPSYAIEQDGHFGEGDENSPYYIEAAGGLPVWIALANKTTSGESYEVDVGVRRILASVFSPPPVPPIPPSQWRRIGYANNIIGLAFTGQKLLGLANDGTLWSRSAAPSDDVWESMGDAHGAKQIAVSNHEIFIWDDEYRLWSKPLGRLGGGLGWTSAGDAFPSEEASPPLAPHGGLLRNVTRASAITSPVVHGVVGNMPKRDSNTLLAAATGIRETSTNAGLSHTVIDMLSDRASTLAANGDHLFFTTKAGECWARSITDASAWLKLNPFGHSLAITCTNQKLIALTKTKELYMRNASIDLTPWQKLNVDLLPGAVSIVGVAESARSFIVFAATTANELYVVELSPLIA